MIITSTSNEKIKEIRKFKDDKEHLFLDGPKLITEAIKANRRLSRLVIESGKEDKYADFCKVADEIIIVSESVFQRLSTTIYSQGVVAIVERKTYEINKPVGNFLVLDEVQDPGNVGTLIRSALAADFMDVYLLNCASLANDKVVRSTMGTLFRIRVHELSREEFIERYKNFSNKNMYTTDMKGENIYTAKFEQPCGIVVGNEGNGVSKNIRELCNKTFSIPMQNDVESLNAGVAGSVIMLQISNKLF